MIRNENIQTVVSKAAKMFANTNARVGSEMEVNTHGDNIKMTLFGFHANRKNAIVEVVINGTLIDKVILKLEGSRFLPKFKTNFEFLYKMKTGALLQKA